MRIEERPLDTVTPYAGNPRRIPAAAVRAVAQSIQRYGDRSQSTVWDIAGMNPLGGGREEKLGHGTQKPIECMERPLRNHEGDVYEPFCGSGTTLIAAERQHRACYALEIEPRYVDMAVARWEAYTGQKAVRAS